MQKLKLSPPWMTYANEVKALFREDKEVRVVYDDEEKKLKLYVDNPRKADALAQLLPAEKTFGNVVIRVEVVPANTEKEKTRIDLIRDAFDKNGAVSFIREGDTPFGHMSYVAFAPYVVQFYNDDMSDVNGNKTTLYQEIAKDVIGTGDGVFFCTENVTGRTNGSFPF